MPIPDFYGECETALRYYLLELTDFFPNDWQVSNDDTNITQGAEYFIVLRPGAFPLISETNSGMVRDYDWEVIMDVYVSYEEYETSWDRFKTLRAALFYNLGINPLLKCNVEEDKSATNVYRVALSSEESAQYFRFDEDGNNQRPNFIIQTMTVTIRQRVELQW